jgi:hypothetical protein
MPSDVPKVLQMDRRGHAMPRMDSVYVHPTDEMRQRMFAGSDRGARPEPVIDVREK